MHIHKPKALHGWREFLGEIGVIVCGVLIAIALEQMVETLHHHGQAREMVRKLREESVENRHVVEYDLAACHSQLAVLDKDIGDIGEALRAGRLPPAPEPFAAQVRFRPANAAWITIRDSALLPIMPKLTVDNYWKIDATNEGLLQRSQDVSRSRRALLAVIAVAHERPIDRPLADDLLLSFSQFRQDERGYCSQLQAFGDDNEKGLNGQVIDISGVRTGVGKTGGG